jgi:hypothetical protein
MRVRLPTPARGFWNPPGSVRRCAARISGRAPGPRGTVSTHQKPRPGTSGRGVAGGVAPQAAAHCGLTTRHRGLRQSGWSGASPPRHETHRDLDAHHGQPQHRVRPTPPGQNLRYPSSSGTPSRTGGSPGRVCGRSGTGRAVASRAPFSPRGPPRTPRRNVQEDPPHIKHVRVHPNLCGHRGVDLPGDQNDRPRVCRRGGLLLCKRRGSASSAVARSTCHDAGDLYASGGRATTPPKSCIHGLICSRTEQSAVSTPDIPPRRRNSLPRTSTSPNCAPSGCALSLWTPTARAAVQLRTHGAVELVHKKEPMRGDRAHSVSRPAANWVCQSSGRSPVEVTP